MAIKLENKVNTEAPSATYPFGNIKDNTGSNNGTPVDKNVYADFHQFFAKMMAESGIAYNDLPDSATDGFQYWLALVEAVKNNCEFYTDLSSVATVSGSLSTVTKKVYQYADGTVMVQLFGDFASNIASGTLLMDNLPLPFSGAQGVEVYLLGGSASTLGKAFFFNNGAVGQVKTLELFNATTYGNLQLTFTYKRAS